MRPVLPEDRLHPAIRDRVASLHRDLIDEVEAALSAHPIVIVGMAQNPHPRRACKALTARNIPHTYLEYGSYLSQWRRRNALKMWTGWPTFPLCFVNGALVGGATELIALLEAGELPGAAPSA